MKTVHDEGHVLGGYKINYSIYGRKCLTLLFRRYSIYYYLNTVDTHWKNKYLQFLVIQLITSVNQNLTFENFTFSIVLNSLVHTFRIFGTHGWIFFISDHYEDDQSYFPLFERRNRSIFVWNIIKAAVIKKSYIAI